MYESAWTLLPGNAGLSSYSLESPCPVTFDQPTDTPPPPQTIPANQPFVTIVTPQIPAVSAAFDQSLGVWLAICIAGITTGQLALEAEAPLLDGILAGQSYAILRRIILDDSIPYQQA